MKEILGHNLKQFFDKNDNVKNTYTGEEYEVWEVSDEIFSRMSNMSENEFIKLAGEGSWWRFANGCSLERPTSSAFINGQYIKCWGKDDIYSEKYERDEFNDEVDISKLRYDKIIILTDADVDGAHISTLLLTFFYRFMPELIYSGKIYRGLPPLYKVDYEALDKKTKKKQSEYVFNDFELEKFRKNKNNKIISIQRYKGLGEMDASQLWETTLDPESRLLAQINISDGVDADDVTTTLMSSNVPPRRQFIMEEAQYANLDI